MTLREKAEEPLDSTDSTYCPCCARRSGAAGTDTGDASGCGVATCILGAAVVAIIVAAAAALL